MAVDIELHSEVKIKGIWCHYSTGYVVRDYDLFGRMAGVENDWIEPIVKPKGLPEDISTITKISRDLLGIDGHHDSWFNAREIASISEWTIEHNIFSSFGRSVYFFEDSIGWLFGNKWEWYFYDPIEHSQRIEDIRFLFWFNG